MSFGSHLIHRATIKRDGGALTDGVWVPNLTTLATDVPCRVVDRTVTEYQDGKEVQVATRAILFQRDQDVTEEDQVVVGSTTYEVRSVRTRNGWRSHHVTCEVREVR